MASRRSTAWDRMLAMQPAPVGDLGDVIAAVAAELPLGVVVQRLSVGWTASFTDLALTAVDVADADNDAVVTLELLLDWLVESRRERRLFAGAAGREADWPVQVALSDTALALDRLRAQRAVCATCGEPNGRYPRSAYLGVGPSYFIEQWCAGCVDDAALMRAVEACPSAARAGFDRLQVEHRATHRTRPSDGASWPVGS